jgi:hypothetical protein
VAVRGAAPSKTVKYVVLPHVTDNGVAQQVTALHVFAIGFRS